MSAIAQLISFPVEEVSTRIECRDNLAFMRPIKDGTVRLIVTSPPYNIGKSYEAKSTLEEYVQSQAQVISECVRLLRPDG